MEHKDTHHFLAYFFMPLDVVVVWSFLIRMLATSLVFLFLGIEVSFDRQGVNGVTVLFIAIKSAHTKRRRTGMLTIFSHCQFALFTIEDVHSLPNKEVQ